MKTPKAVKKQPAPAPARCRNHNPDITASRKEAHKRKAEQDKAAADARHAANAERAAKDRKDWELRNYVLDLHADMKRKLAETLSPRDLVLSELVMPDGTPLIRHHARPVSA